MNKTDHLQDKTNETEKVHDNIYKTPEKENAQLSKVPTWPDRPKRKGKRRVERDPFVLTSSKWNEIQQEKKRLKLEKEQ